MKIPFDIKFRPQIESGEYKVETRDGKKVRVLCYDANNIVPVVALVTFNDGSEGSRDYYLDGSMNFNRENPLDLFVVTPEEELTEFEQAIKEMMRGYVKMPDEVIKETAARLRKELQSEYDGKAMSHVSEKSYEMGKRDGKAEALKDLPRWKKATGKERFNERMIVLAGDDDLLCTNYAEEGEYYISFPDLEKLPKED